MPSSPDQEETDASHPPIALSEGKRLREEYRVEEVLGMGSFGITYRALDEHLNTSVAIKEYYPRQIAGRTGESSTLRPHSSEATEDFEYGLQQFMEEGRTVARFDHPNVVDVKSYFQENGTGYLVMDYYEGQSLSDYLTKNNGKLPEKEALELIQDVLDGLRPVHKAGVLHRDIDPQNIYRTEEGKAILIDFGAAREAIGERSQSLDVILKPGYAPIEQYSSGSNQGPHTDVYACAATLYKCLTGVKPPEATGRVQTDDLIPPSEINPEVSLETDLSVRKGLALKPEKRVGSAQEFAALLQSVQDGSGPTEQARESTHGTTRGEVPEVHKAPDEMERATQNAHVTSDTDFSITTGGSEVSDGTWGLTGTVIGLVAVVGLALAFSDTGLVQILAFFGTWVVVCGGLIGLFRQGERLMRPESKAAISDWLLGEDFVEKASSWPSTFADLFDAVFSEYHLSWTCFRRSALVSLVVVLMLFCVFIWLVASQVIFRTQVGPILLPLVWNILELESGTYALKIPPSLTLLSFLGSTLAIAVANVGIDYLSLFETRWVVSLMSRSSHTIRHIVYLIIDFALTLLLAFIPLFLFFLFEHPEYYELGGLTGLLLASQKLVHSIFVETHIDVGYQYIMLLSTLFTSVWIWLYVGAGLLLRAFWPLLKGLNWLKQIFDVESRPAETMGFLLATIVSVGFAATAPFVL